MDFWLSRFLYWLQFLRGLRLGPTSDANADGLPLNYDSENELCEQYCLTQSNGNEHYAGAKLILKSENADFLDENGKKVARGVGPQLPRQAMPNNY